MRREIFEQIEPVLNEIDKHLVEVSKKYGDIYADNRWFTICEPPEEDSYTDGTRVTIYYTLCPEELDINEPYEDTESIDGIEFIVPAYTLKKDEFGNMEIAFDMSAYWEGEAFYLHFPGGKREVA